MSEQKFFLPYLLGLLSTALIVVILVMFMAGQRQEVLKNHMQDEIDGDNTRDVDDEMSDAEESFEIAGAYLAVHLEVDNLPTIRQRWPLLQETVALADEYGVKLTFLTSPSWADFFLSDEDALNEFRSWEENGHEIGAHHHSIEHLYWDGYTNDLSYAGDPDYRGDMQDFLDLLNQLPEDGSVEAGGIMDAVVDWPIGLEIQSTNSGGGTGKSYGMGGPDPREMLGPVSYEDYLGEEILTFSKAGFAIGNLSYDLSIDDLLSALSDAEANEYFGLVINDDTIENQKDKYLELLEMYSNHGIEVVRISELL